MSRTVSKGPLSYIARSWARMIAVSLRALWRHLFHGPLVPGWPLDFEIGNLFWRGQFNHAFAMADIRQARIYFDSLQTYTDETYDVARKASPSGAPKGDWITPTGTTSKATLLYFHGGGYTFHAAITHRFAEMLAALLGTRLFALDYRLTPEHPHPAQLEDALAAYSHLLAEGVDPKRLVVIGDSAGGHLTLMTLVALQDVSLPQPALAIGLCPWTDIGARGASLHANDRYDLVQGYMALRFGEWLQGSGGYSREELSPIHKNYAGLAPIYLQGGGRESLIDMIRDFARVVADQGCEVTLDVWPEMTHNFQANGLTRIESAEAIKRIRVAIAKYTSVGATERMFEPCDHTEVYNRAAALAPAKP
jgi:epsilon-lactone hydrolase